MRKRGQLTQNYFLLAFTLFLFISFPQSSVDRLRGFTASFMRPTWSMLASLKRGVFHPLTKTTPHPYPELGKGKIHLKDRVKHLQLENRLLRNELESFQHSLHSSKSPKAIPAKILYRTSSTWSESFWIDVGERDNRKLKQKVIIKNSPVLLGDCLVGVLDYVGNKQSRVKLITGSNMIPAVRSVRGNLQNLHTLELVESLISSTQYRDELFKSPDEKNNFEANLVTFKDRLLQEPHTVHLAKGELQGSQNPLWRKNSTTLTGVGFNYDFADDHGPARDLRTGEPIGVKGMSPISILEEGDLLVTSGLDGIFPEGIPVATVTYVEPLKEGSYYYKIEAKVAAPSIDSASHVSVIAPGEGVEKR